MCLAGKKEQVIFFPAWKTPENALLTFIFINWGIYNDTFVQQIERLVPLNKLIGSLSDDDDDDDDGNENAISKYNFLFL